MKPKIAARKWSTGKFRAKLRMVKRGWTQPNKELRGRIATGINRKLANSATIDELLGAMRKSGFERLASAVRIAAKKQRAEAIQRSVRTATKYALDSVGITDQKTRAEIHSLTKDMTETVVYGGYNSISERHLTVASRTVSKKIGGVKMLIFFKRFFSLSTQIIKDTITDYGK